MLSTFSPVTLTLLASLTSLAALSSYVVMMLGPAMPMSSAMKKRLRNMMKMSRCCPLCMV